MNKKKLIKLLIGIVILVLFIVFDKYIECPFHHFLHLYCPGCGITRCIISCFKLDFYQAFRYNVVVFCLLPFLTIYLFYKLYVWLFDKKDKIIEKIPTWLLYLIIVILIIFGILRNIKMFDWLAPTEIIK